MAKNSATKGAKKSRRMGRPRSATANIACAKRKQQRITEAFSRKVANNALRDLGLQTAWEISKAKRYEARH